MSMNPSTGLNVCVVDAGCLTPAYDSELCRALAQQGHRVSLVTAPYHNDPDYRFPEEIEVAPLFFRGIGLGRHPRLRRVLKGLSYARDFSRVLNHLVRREVDVIHLQWLMIPPLDYWFVRRIKRLCPQAAVLVTVHDVDPLFKLVGARFLSRVLALVDGVIVHGDSAKTELLRAMPGLSPNKVRVMAHGPLHQAKDVEAPLEAEAARLRLGIPQDRHVALFFGELRAYKGLDVLVNALAGLAEQDRERLTVVIAGKLEEPGCATELARLERLALDTRLNIGYVPTDEISTYFRAADFVVLPYKSITQSGILLTALANGRQVLASDVGELGEVVRRTAGGWIVPADDPLALRNGFRQVLRTDRRVLARDGEQSQVALERQFGWARIAADTAGFYQEILRSKEAYGELPLCENGY